MVSQNGGDIYAVGHSTWLLIENILWHFERMCNISLSFSAVSSADNHAAHNRYDKYRTESYGKNCFVHYWDLSVLAALVRAANVRVSDNLMTSIQSVGDLAYKFHATVWGVG